MMIPIHQLLSRIRWDREFGAANFVIGYHDRVEDEIILAPFSDLIFPPDRSDLVGIMDPDGVVRSIPLHRIKKVFRDRKLIWERK